MGGMHMGGRRRNKVGLLLIITSVAIAISKIGVQLHLTRRLQTSPLSGDNLLETLESLLHAYHRRARSEIPEFHCGVQLESIRLDQITIQHDSSPGFEFASNMTQTYDGALGRMLYTPRPDLRFVQDHFITTQEADLMRENFLSILEYLSAQGDEYALGIPSKVFGGGGCSKTSGWGSLQTYNKVLKFTINKIIIVSKACKVVRALDCARGVKLLRKSALLVVQPSTSNLPANRTWSQRNMSDINSYTGHHHTRPRCDKCWDPHYDVSAILFLSDQGAHHQGGAGELFEDTDAERVAAAAAAALVQCSMQRFLVMQVEARKGRLLCFSSGFENMHRPQNSSDDGRRVILEMYFTRSHLEAWNEQQLECECSYNRVTERGNQQEGSSFFQGGRCSEDNFFPQDESKHFKLREDARPEEEGERFGEFLSKIKQEEEEASRFHQSLLTGAINIFASDTEDEKKMEWIKTHENLETRVAGGSSSHTPRTPQVDRKVWGTQLTYLVFLSHKLKQTINNRVEKRDREVDPNTGGNQGSDVPGSNEKSFNTKDPAEQDEATENNLASHSFDLYPTGDQ
eukprot:jgi/Bigna1/68793/fgenesh1_pg.7_\